MKNLAVVIAALAVFVVGIQLAIHHGRRLESQQWTKRVEVAYSDGWRDAHCGVGQSCESGDE